MDPTDAQGLPFGPLAAGDEIIESFRLRWRLRLLSRTSTATFRVLNDDRVGSLRLPRGNYLITLLPGSGLICPVAADLFAAFLRHPDGRLPRPWRLDAQTATFTRGSGSSIGFSVEPAGNAR